MAGRSIWNGFVRVGKVSVPVKVYAAVEDRTVRFQLLHRRDKQRVRQRLEDPVTGKEVQSAEIRKGYEVEPGVFVLVSDEEIEKLEPPASREIEITRFVDRGQVGPHWYERPYYLGPDGDKSDYFALAAALGRSEKQGMARWVMRKRRYVGALLAEKGRLMLVSLRPSTEIVDVAAIPKPAGAVPTKKELEMAEQLVRMLAGSFEPEAYRDEYRERVEALIEAKTRGKVFRFEQARPKPRPADLEGALAASLTKVAKERRSA